MKWNIIILEYIDSLTDIDEFLAVLPNAIYTGHVKDRGYEIEAHDEFYASSLGEAMDYVKTNYPDAQEFTCESTGHEIFTQEDIEI